MNILKIVVTLVIAGIVLVLILRSRKSRASAFLPGNSEESGPPLTAEEVVQECRKADLSKVADDLEKVILHCFCLVPMATDERSRPYQTQVGGTPDLPGRNLWPKHEGKSLSFVAQVNLSDIRNEIPESNLPKTGMLYFFYVSEQSTWGFDPKDKGSWRVLYVEKLPEDPPEGGFPDDVPEHARYSRKVLKAVAGKSIPEPLEYMIKSELPEKQQDLVLDFYGRYSEQGPPKHQLLGYPMPIQGEMQLECQLVSHGLYCGDEKGYNDPRSKGLEAGAQNWKLLFQIDTDNEAGMMWGDCGRIYFWIQSNDLREKNFDAVWMILQCG